jgi:hypothetical protein
MFPFCSLFSLNVLDKDHTTLIIAFVGLLTRELYIRNFFVRTFVLDDMLKKIRILVMTYQKDPNHIQRIRDKLNDASRDIILLQEILEYLKESLDEMVPPPMGEDRVSKRIYKVLDVPQMRTDIIMRCTDLVKLIHGANNTVSEISLLTCVQVHTKVSFYFFESFIGVTNQRVYFFISIVFTNNTTVNDTATYV